MKRYTYSDASICQVSNMICTSCRKPILEGAFRFRETEEAYLPQHRSCTSQDPEWAAIDHRQQLHTAYAARRKLALRKFIEEFGEPDEDLVAEIVREKCSVAIG